MQNSPPAPIAAPRNLIGPFVGDFTASTWNAQGFFTAKALQHNRKRAFVRRLLAKSDLVLLTETHVTKGSKAVFEEIPGTKSWWSPGTAARGGVGVIASSAFLERFMLEEPTWDEFQPGRLARLSLLGPDGRLDVVAAYFPTGTKAPILPEGVEEVEGQEELSLRKQREALAREVRSHLRPSQALSVVAGDFNFVTDCRDRFSKESGKFSGGSDAAEAVAWKRLFGDGSLLHEIWQEHATHDGPRSRGRLDRVYINQCVSEQLDRTIFVALWHGVRSFRSTAFWFSAGSASQLNSR